MTEDQAKTKWCPIFSVLQTTFYIAKPGMQINHEYGRCTGSDCMMWRLERPRFVEAEEWAGDSKQLRTAVHKPGDGDGYCGLAGKP